MALPTFGEWLALSEPERRDLQTRWNPYAGEGWELVSEIAADFRAKHGHLPGIQVVGPGVYHGGYWVIGVRLPFVFDRRELPGSHLGITVHSSLAGALPPEFEDGRRTHSYVWAPQHYEQFVDRCADQIRDQLGRPDLDRTEMLAALVGMPFSEYVEKTQSVRSESSLPVRILRGARGAVRWLRGWREIWRIRREACRQRDSA